jgi:hypothetical protein
MCSAKSPTLLNAVSTYGFRTRFIGPYASHYVPLMLPAVGDVEYTMHGRRCEDGGLDKNQQVASDM